MRGREERRLLWWASDNLNYCYDDNGTLFHHMSYLKIITIMRNNVILTLQIQIRVTEDHHPQGHANT